LPAKKGNQRRKKMELVMWEPFETLNGLHSRINKLFDEGFRPSWAKAGSASAVWYPPVDVLESKDSYILRAELPGMKKEDFNLEVKDGRLTLTGERKFEHQADGVEYHSAERVTGKFVRSFQLPREVKHDAIEATYRDGVLEIRVPKAEEAKPRQIAISLN
jgi:HSP20 family protein